MDPNIFWESIFKHKERDMLYPSELLLRWYFHNNIRPTPKDNVCLDHGAGTGGNAIFLATKGWDIVCSDIGGIPKILEDKLKGYSFNVRAIQIKENQTLELDDNSISLLVCCGALHFAAEESDLALRELSRVLKTGRRFFFTIKGSEDFLLKRSTLIEPDLYEIGSGFTDFQGGRLWVPGSPEKLRQKFRILTKKPVHIGYIKYTANAGVPYRPGVKDDEMAHWYIVSGER